MRKFSYLMFLVMSVVLISCGGKNSESKENKEANTEEATSKDCLISELGGIEAKKNIVKKGSKDLYTGVAIEKDQNDSIIRKVEIKNGWLVKEVSRKNIYGKYITDKEITYDNALPNGGYKSIIAKREDNNYKEIFQYVNAFYDDIDALSYDLVDASFGYTYSVEVNYWGDNDVSVIFRLPPGGKHTLPNFTNKLEMEGDDYGAAKHISIQEMYQILDEMKKELPHFDYWKK